MEPRFVFAPEAASFLGMSVVALKRRVARRTVPFIKDGKRVRFDLKALEAFMVKRTVKGDDDDD